MWGNSGIKCDIMQRNLSVDIAKGIAIILVIVGHCHCIGNLTFKIIYSFHMPLFFMFAGWFYKKREVTDSIKHDFHRLIVPYLVFASIGTLKFFITQTLIQGDWKTTFDNILAILWSSSTGHTSLFFSNINTIGIIWFLPALFVCKNLYNIVIIVRYRLRLEHDFVFFILIILISYLCAVVDRWLVNLPFALLTGGGAMIFFYIGHCIKDKCISVWIRGILVVCWIFAVRFSYLLMGNNHYGIYLLDVAGAVGATLLLMSIVNRCVGGGKNGIKRSCLVRS